MYIQESPSTAYSMYTYVLFIYTTVFIAAIVDGLWIILINNLWSNCLMVVNFKKINKKIFK